MVKRDEKHVKSGKTIRMHELPDQMQEKKLTLIDLKKVWAAVNDSWWFVAWFRAKFNKKSDLTPESHFK